MNLLPTHIFGKLITNLPDPQIANLPLFISATFDIGAFQMDEITGITMSTQNQVTLAQILSAVETLRDLGHENVIICSSKLSIYQRDRLSEANISFITSKGNMFLPFMGTAITMERKGPKPEKTLSPQAQRLFLSALRGEFLGLPAQEIARAMGRSPASVTRYMDEIEAISPGMIERDGKLRVLKKTTSSLREVFELFKPFLSTPLRSTHYAHYDGQEEKIFKMGGLLAGVSALSKLGMIADDGPTTFALEGEGSVDRLIQGGHISIVDSEEANLIIEVWKYMPDAHPEDCVDEISLFLSLQDEAKHDPRIDLELGKMLRRVLDADAS